MDIGLVMRNLGGNFTAAHCNMEELIKKYPLILTETSSHISDITYPQAVITYSTLTACDKTSSTTGWQATTLPSTNIWTML